MLCNTGFLLFNWRKCKNCYSTRVPQWPPHTSAMIFLTCAHIYNVHIPCNWESLVPPFHHKVWTADMEIRLEKSTVVTLKERKVRSRDLDPAHRAIFIRCIQLQLILINSVGVGATLQVDLQYLLKTNLPAVAASLKVTALLTHWYAVLLLGRRNKIQMSRSINQVVHFLGPETFSETADKSRLVFSNDGWKSNAVNSLWCRLCTEHTNIFCSATEAWWTLCPPLLP